jgi:hypothetical protein
MAGRAVGMDTGELADEPAGFPAAHAAAEHERRLRSVGLLKARPSFNAVQHA